MKRGAFVDTVYILALLNPRDRWHRKAIELSRTRRAPLVTSHAVLTEVADALAHRSRRAWASQAIHDLQADPDVTCISIDAATFTGGLQLHRERPDEDWSLTDCLSFFTMQQQQLTDALTADVTSCGRGFGH